MLLLTMPIIDIEPVVDFYFQMFFNNKNDQKIDLFVDQVKYNERISIQYKIPVVLSKQQKHYITLFI